LILGNAAEKRGIEGSVLPAQALSCSGSAGLISASPYKREAPRESLKMMTEGVIATLIGLRRKVRAEQ